MPENIFFLNDSIPLCKSEIKIDISITTKGKDRKSEWMVCALCRYWVLFSIKKKKWSHNTNLKEIICESWFSHWKRDKCCVQSLNHYNLFKLNDDFVDCSTLCVSESAKKNLENNSRIRNTIRKIMIFSSNLFFLFHFSSNSLKKPKLKQNPEFNGPPNLMAIHLAIFILHLCIVHICPNWWIKLRAVSSWYSFI